MHCHVTRTCSPSFLASMPAYLSAARRVDRLRHQCSFHRRRCLARYHAHSTAAVFAGHRHSYFRPWYPTPRCGRRRLLPRSVRAYRCRHVVSMSSRKPSHDSLRCKLPRKHVFEPSTFRAEWICLTPCRSRAVWSVFKKPVLSRPGSKLRSQTALESPVS